MSEAQAAFQYALAGFRSVADARAVGQAYCELAMLALCASQYAEMAEWLYAYQDVAQVGRSPALHRLRHALIGLLEVYRSGNAELLASAARFTAEIAPALLAASRCELAHDLALRGLLDDVAREAVGRLALGQPRMGVAQ